MDTSADTAAWVAAVAAVGSLAIVAVQFSGARKDRFLRHDVDALQRMLTIITDPQVANNTPWTPLLFRALALTLSINARQLLPNLRDANMTKASLSEHADEIALDLLQAIRARVGLGN